MKKLAVGVLPQSLNEIVPAHTALDTEVSGLIVHNASPTAAWCEIWLMGARMARFTVQTGQSINVLKYLGLEHFSFPAGDSIEGVAQISAQINYVVFGSRFKAA